MNSLSELTLSANGGYIVILQRQAVEAHIPGHGWSPHWIVLRHEQFTDSGG